MTTTQLLHIAPSIKNVQQWVDLLNKYMGDYQINTKARVAAFLANCAHESMQFNMLREMASGAEYEGNKNLGNVVPGDGVKYKGRGVIQLTGRWMYSAIGHDLKQDFIGHPELLEQPDYATESACWFWNFKSLSVIADKPDDWKKLSKNGNTYEKFHWICRLINGGDNGLAERQAFYKRALEVL